MKTTVVPLGAKYRYDISAHTWTSTSVKSANLEMENIGPDSNGSLEYYLSGMSTCAPKIKRGFALGGTTLRLVNGSSHFALWPHRGLLLYDLDSDSWKNETMPSNAVTRGVLAHVIVGDDELLITFGGSTNPASSDFTPPLV